MKIYSVALLLSPLLLSPSCSSLSATSAPYVGVSTKAGVKFIVIGTSHFRCNSANEVTSLIEEVKPDGVVVELDPERVIRLTKEGSMSDGEQLLGADFLAAIETSQKMDIPIFIGDEYTKETKARLVQTAFSPKTYTPVNLLDFFFRQRPPSSSVDFAQTFWSDPLKLAPLATTISPPFLLLLLTLQNYNIADTTADASLLSSIVFSFLASCKVFNTLIADRDEILASNAIKASNVIKSLQKKETIRKRWTFSVDDNDNAESGTKHTSSTTSNKRSTGTPLPLFTLKTPLERDNVRNLNLFETRWLKMIDDLQVELPLSSVSPSSGFGCVTCTNKFYSAINLNGAEGRYADVIFKRKGRMASLTGLTEGQRPSGARKVSVSIEGRDSFTVNEGDLSVVEEGYLVASNIQSDDVTTSSDKKSYTSTEEDIKIVVVAGMLHANGIIDRLS